jgi:hypothetical protein
MHMFRWAGNAKEWTEYAMRLRPAVSSALETPGEALLTSLRRQSGCAISIGSDLLNGQTEKFLVFVRGDSGQPSNGAMTLALELFSQTLRGELRDALGSAAGPGAAAAGAAAGAGAMMTGSADDEDYPEGDDDDAGAQGAGAADVEDRIQRVLELPLSAVALIAGKAGKKLYAMRKKSGAYVALVSRNKSKGPAKLTISGTVAAVEKALNMVKIALSEGETNEA